MKYHVADGKVMAADMTNGKVFKTLQGEDWKIDVAPAGAKTVGPDLEILEDKITRKALIEDRDEDQWAFKDVEATNGVVHLVDMVIFPPTITRKILGKDDSKSKGDGTSEADVDYAARKKAAVSSAGFGLLLVGLLGVGSAV